MEVEVKFFASLRERFGHGAATVAVAEGASVSEVWRAVSGEEALDGNLRAAVNFEYVEPDQVVNAGDEVAFFPPVTGG